MDPICHTLVGGSLAAAGLERKTRFGRAILLIAANLPDVDGIAYFWGHSTAHAFRRGITHGLPALLVLPFVLAALGIVWDRWRPPPDPTRRASFRWLLGLSAIGIATHPILDWLNTYGMRWLMPFSDRWFYGDTLFIVDGVAWLVLTAGLLATRFLFAGGTAVLRRPALIALALLTAYIGMNLAITRAAEAAVREALREHPPSRLMASPVPLNPFRRDIVLAYPEEYRFGTYVPGRTPALQWHSLRIPRGQPADFERARERIEGRRFLEWARFPYARSETGNGETTIRLADARYVRDPRHPDGFAAVTLRWKE